MASTTGALSLGRLEKVDLRLGWSSEPGGFTPWLAQEENLSLLARTIGLQLELEAQEKAVGPFSADILCRNVDEEDHWVLIENQLERTDHRHLGQILTYAAGLKAVTIVWIAAAFTEQHRAALDWLNEITDARFNFFGLEIELWRIGDSPAAPKFNIISKPNDWSREVSGGVRDSELTETQELQLAFWTGFLDYIETRSRVLPTVKPYPRAYLAWTTGTPGVRLRAVASMWSSEHNSFDKNELRAEFFLRGPKHRQRFAQLQSETESIREELGASPDWYAPEDAKRCAVRLVQTVDFSKREQWPAHYHWLTTNLEKLRSVLLPRIRKQTGT